MNLLIDIVSGCLIAAGLLFYMAGTVGLLRFPDLFTRLHAMSKADNVGLGLLMLGLLLQVDNWRQALKYVFAWVLVMLASAVTSQLVARSALRAGLQPWRRP